MTAAENYIRSQLDGKFWRFASDGKVEVTKVKKGFAPDYSLARFHGINIVTAAGAKAPLPPAKPSPWTDEKVEMVRQLRADGTPIAKIVKAVGVSTDQVIVKCRELGFPTRIGFGRPAKLSEADEAVILEKVEIGWSQQRVANFMNLNRSIVESVVRRSRERSKP